MLKNTFLRSILLLVFVLFGTIAQAATDCAKVTEIPAVECQALIAIYNSTDGTHWKNNTGWNVTNTPCSWYGIMCGNGHVTRLNLHHNQLKGSMPAELANLIYLEVIRLHNNQLRGFILDKLGKMKHLWFLYQGNNLL